MPLYDAIRSFLLISLRLQHGNILHLTDMTIVSVSYFSSLRKKYAMVHTENAMKLSAAN